MKIKELIERLSLCEDQEAEIVVCVDRGDEGWYWESIACIENDCGDPDTYYLGLMPFEEEV